VEPAAERQSSRAALPIQRVFQVTEGISNLGLCTGRQEVTRPIPSVQGCTDRASRASSMPMELLVKAPIEEPLFPGPCRLYSQAGRHGNIPTFSKWAADSFIARMTIQFFPAALCFHIRTSRSQSDFDEGTHRLGWKKVGEVFCRQGTHRRPTTLRT